MASRLVEKRHGVSVSQRSLIETPPEEYAFTGGHCLFPEVGNGKVMRRKDRCVASLCFAQPNRCHRNNVPH
jgi:hypothetical protein